MAGQRAADAAGQFYAADPIVTGLPLGNTAIQIRVWFNNGLYASYEAALLAGANVGKSAVMTINLKAPTDPTVQSLTDIGMASFTVGTAPPAPTIALANPGTQVPAGSLPAGSTAHVLLKFQTAVTGAGANATLNTVNFTTAGTCAAADLSNLKLWYNAASSFSGAAQIGASLTGSGIGAGAHSFSALAQTIAYSSTGYFFITADVAPGATPGRTLSVNAIGNSDLTFASGTPTGGPTSAGGTQTITGTTVNTLASSLNPSTFGSSVTFTATVSPSAASGTVTFKDGAATLGTGTLSGGVATFATSGLSVGGHSLTAEYGGDSGYLGSTNSPALTQTVNPAGPATHTAIGNGPWSSPSTWSDGIVPAAGEDVVIPTGFTVALDINTAAIRNLTLAGTLTVPVAQTLTLSGNYTNTGTFTAGSGTVELTGGSNQVLAATAPGSLTFYKLTENKDPATATASSKLKVTKKLTLTAGKLVSASDYGDIEIGMDGELQLTSDITVSGHFINWGTLTTGGHGITFDGGVEQNLTLANGTWFDNLTVTTNTTLVETESANNVIFNDNGTVLNQGVIRKTQVLDGTDWYYFGLAGNDASADIEIHVTDLTGGDPLTAIQVDRRDTNHPNASGTNTTGIYWTITPTGTNFVASLALPQDGLPDPQVCRYRSSAWDWARSAFETNTVTRTGLTAFGDFAVFNDPHFTTSTTTALASSLNPSTVGASVNFTATVSPSAASGTVTFKDGATTLGTGTLSGGVASFATSSLALGSHSLTAEYAGDANHLASTSLVLTQTVYVATAAVNDTLGARANTNTTVAASVLTDNDIFAGIYTVTITGVTYTGGHGGAVALAGLNVLYTPATDYTGSDAFTYTISDGHGGTAVGTVAVTVSASGAGKAPSPGGIVVANGKVTLTFRGVPHRTYQVQWTADLGTPNWQDLGTTTAGRTGSMTYEDTPPGGAGSRFYRIVYPITNAG